MESALADKLLGVCPGLHQISSVPSLDLTQGDPLVTTVNYGGPRKRKLVLYIFL